MGVIPHRQLYTNWSVRVYPTVTHNRKVAVSSDLIFSLDAHSGCHSKVWTKISPPEAHSLLNGFLKVSSQAAAEILFKLRLVITNT